MKGIYELTKKMQQTLTQQKNIQFAKQTLIQGMKLQYKFFKRANLKC